MQQYLKTAAVALAAVFLVNQIKATRDLMKYNG